MRLLVPLYENPADRPEAWRRLFLAAPRLYGVVLNPASGVGTAPDPAFVDIAARLRAAGVRLLGYADTAYGARRHADVLAELDRYRAWYGTDGAFLDQAAGSTAELPEYARLAALARRRGVRTIVFNHGTHPEYGYTEHADLLVTFEGDWTSYLTARSPHWTRRVPPGRLCHLVYGVPAGQADRVSALAEERGAGVCCAVPGGLPHPWDNLPEQLETA
ncbi:spherulation-specific family 4 protein [Streptomyces alkaliterrae]|uniref:Spherulation-specific family 4 n=1 Tax=Streptomyces alkaliterrae TaxID=2213162 RepID=A0A5P0YSE9_9ACTN|nr:spherulation-specific family 4 protein [Streptomyces alkaliterrae]MBB1254783.1 hypothetical protein [Streptomyces alkaliterrae]MBB1261189.1 hypothetical protein [Streptomyces alkaliterrae]MQS03215.1 hypothetical protein [Streptomyces alkaliterrae]